MKKLKNPGIDWHCDGCGTFLNSQRGFTDWSGEWTCEECGYVNDVTENNIIWDDDDFIDDDWDDDDDDWEPEGCAACGNPAYPDCMNSCPLYDD